MPHLSPQILWPTVSGVPVLPGLLDPKWMEERQRSMAEKQEQEEVLAAGSDIDVSLKQLAERRTDIFGIGTEETQIGKKVSSHYCSSHHPFCSSLYLCSNLCLFTSMLK